MPEVIIDNFPEVITKEEFGVTVTIKGARPAINYLRILIYKEGSKKYFGETFNGNEWIKYGDGKSYFPIVVDSANVMSTIKGRVGSDLIESGEYRLQVKRYTASGNLADDTTNDVSVNIQIAVVTATPVPASIQTEVPVVINTSTQKPKATNSPIKKPQAVKQVLAVGTHVPDEVEINSEKVESDIQINIIMMITGVLFILFSFGMLLIKRKQKL